MFLCFRCHERKYCNRIHHSLYYGLCRRCKTIDSCCLDCPIDKEWPVRKRKNRAQKMSVFDKLALLPVYARKRLRSRDGLAVLREPEKSESLNMWFTPATLEHMNKLAEATSSLVGFRVSQEQLAGLLVEIILETASRKELLKILKMRKPG